MFPFVTYETGQLVRRPFVVTRVVNVDPEVSVD